MQPNSDPNCPFCKIVSGEYPSKEVYSDSRIKCVLDINPATKGHVLIFPKNHYAIMPVIPPDEFKHLVKATINMSQVLRSRMLSSKNKIFIANGGVAGQQVSHFLIHIISIEHKEDKDDEIYKALRNNLNIMMANHSKREGKNILSNETEHLFETDELIATIPNKIASKGHIKIKAKNKHTSVEDFFYLASYSATAVFEYLGAHGTNIIIDESDENLTAHVIPRFSGDNLNFLWTPNKMDEIEMNKIQKSISFGTIGMSVNDFPVKPVIEKDTVEENLDNIKPMSNNSNFISDKLNGK